MSTRVAIDQFKLPNGAIDWTRFEQAQIANGERCPTCRVQRIPLIIEPRGKPLNCATCQGEVSLSLPRPAGSESRVKCPKCLCLFEPPVVSLCEPDDSGTERVRCPECSATFDAKWRSIITIVWASTEPEGGGT